MAKSWSTIHIFLNTLLQHFSRDEYLSYNTTTMKIWAHTTLTNEFRLVIVPRPHIYAWYIVSIDTSFVATSWASLSTTAFDSSYKDYMVFEKWNCTHLQLHHERFCEQIANRSRNICNENKRKAKLEFCLRCIHNNLVEKQHTKIKAISKRWSSILKWYNLHNNIRPSLPSF